MPLEKQRIGKRHGTGVLCFRRYIVGMVGFLPSSHLIGEPRGKIMRRALGTALTVLLSTVCFAAQPDRIIGSIDNGQTVPLRGSVHAKAQAQYDAGPVESAMKLPYITMMMRPSGAQQASLERLLKEQQDPASPNYHKWLTPEQYAQRFGLGTGDLSKVGAWLESQGFRIVQTARGQNWIAFSGTAALVESAFHTQIHYFDVEGERHFANATDIEIPEALDGIVVGFRGLTDFALKPMGIRQVPNEFFPLMAQPFYTSGGSHFLAPDDIAMIYDITALYNAGFNGTGQSMVIVGQTDIDMADLKAFRSGFGLPAIVTSGSSANFKDIVVPNSPDPGTTADLAEADLDLEWSNAVARKAFIYFVTAATSVGGVFLSAQYAIDNNLAPVISMSYGGCESGNVQFIPGNEPLMQQASTEGITFMASSGDEGAAGCDSDTSKTATGGLAVNYPASSPEVTGVGGTEFNEAGGNYWNSSNDPVTGRSAISYIPEIGWNDTSLNIEHGLGLAASGGGASSCGVDSGNTCEAGFPKPSWQTGTGVPNDGVRDVPDVSMAASADHDGYILCSGGSCAGGIAGAVSANSIVGGTSAAAPIFAGIVVLLNQFVGVKQGNINQKLYPLAQNAGNGAFHDITTGTNIVPCTPGTPSSFLAGLQCPGSGSFGYNAGKGYDLVTGLGSVDAANLITGTNGAVALTPQDVTPVGSHVPVSMTVKITPLWGSGTPSGTVNFFNGSTQINPTAITLSGGMANYPSYDPSTLTAGIYPITAKYSGDTTYKASSSSANLTVGTITTTALSMSPTSLNVGSASPVNLSATVTPSSGGPPTGSVTFMNGSTAIGSPVPLSASGGASLSYNPSSLTGGTYPITATYSGDTQFVTSTSAAQSLNVVDFSIAASPTTVSISAPGGTGTATITITDLGGFNANLSFSCAGLPSQANCTFTPVSATSETLTITTTAATAKLERRPHMDMRAFYALLLPGLMGIVVLPGTRKKMRWLILIGVLAISVLWMAGCGGGGGSNPPSNPGTPAGNSTITISAATSGANAVTHTTKITLSVQ